MCALNQFVTSDKRTQPRHGIGLIAEESLFLSFRENEPATVGGLAAFLHLRKSGPRLGARRQDEIRPSDEVGTDVCAFTDARFELLFVTVVVVKFANGWMAKAQVAAKAPAIRERRTRWRRTTIRRFKCQPVNRRLRSL